MYSLQVFSAIRLVNGSDYIPEGLVEANAPALKAHYDAVMSNPKVSFILALVGLSVDHVLEDCFVHFLL